MTIDGCNISKKEVLSMGIDILDKEAGLSAEQPTDSPACYNSVKVPMTVFQMTIICGFAPDR
jgi:hypothetical protein